MIRRAVAGRAREERRMRGFGAIEFYFSSGLLEGIEV